MQTAKNTHPLAQRSSQLAYGLKVMDGTKLVSVRQDGLNTERQRLKVVETQKRVQPNQSPARFLQTLHLFPVHLL